METDAHFSQCDYPAAHSMDTTWFAVDRDGFVAVMETQEEGALPLSCGSDNGDDSGELIEAVSRLSGREIKLGQYDEPLPESVGLYFYTADLDWQEEMQVEMDPETDETGFAPPYSRREIPENPVHISSLPESFKSQIEKQKFADLSFREAKWIQPALRLRCQMWTTEDNYICADETGEIVDIPIELQPREGDFGGFFSTPTSASKSSAGADSGTGQTSTGGQKPSAPWWKKLFGG